MKKAIYFLITLFLISCSKEHSTEYASISGLISNNDAKEISIIGRGFKKIIPIGLDGTFSDTVKVVKNGYHTFYDGKNRQTIYLKNGDDLSFNYDYKNIIENFNIEGSGAESSNYLIQKEKFNRKEKLNDQRQLFTLKKDVFDTRITYLENEVKKMLSNSKIDSVLKANESTNFGRVFNSLKKQYDKEHKLTSALAIGKPSPKFSNYLNYNGGKTSLADYKGKYVYLDIWATWCGPCKRQIPHLAKIEKLYHNKNIEFVSISTDDARRNNGSWDNAKDKWKKMIKDKKMGGTQLFADRGFQSDFIKAYGIRSIPRFILIDPNGNIVNANAPRPSQESLKQLLDGLL